MYEQDIELAKLLLSRMTDLHERGEEVNRLVLAARHELSQLNSVRDERSKYIDVLARAARLLDRADLEIESPQTEEIEGRIAALGAQLTEINRESQQYGTLISELRQSAPRLVALAAGEEQPAQPAEEEAEADDADEPSAADPLYAVQIAGEQAVDADADAEEEEEEGQQAAEHAAPQELDPAAILARFNTGDLKTKETFTFGRGAIYIVDGSSVLERVPHYDTHFRAIRENEARDELLRDVNQLGGELSGTFCVVFSNWHQPQAGFGEHVRVEYGTGEGEGMKTAGDRRIAELVAEMSSRDRSVCVVTGDTPLADALRGPGVHIISLGEFFKT